MEFRLLEASEIECRVAQIKDNGLSLLLYKDARVDQNILDETVGALNWQRAHSRDNANCTVSIWDADKACWVSKEDTGKESFTEAEKGLASDSFKRACFNWGIGRELYTAPFIWITDDKAGIRMDGGKARCYERFSVSDIAYDAKRNISRLTIVNSKGTEVYSFGVLKPQEKAKKSTKEVAKESNNADVQYAVVKAKVLKYINNNVCPESIEKICKHFGIKTVNDMDMAMCNQYIASVQKQGGNINE